MDSPLCTRAAALIVKYDIHQGSHKPVLLPDAVVIDPDNRDGLFPTAVDVADLAEAILGCGFSIQMTRGVCCQLPVSDTQRANILQYNREKGATDPSFPRVLPQHAMFSGIAGNTLNTFLRCVAQGCPPPEGKLQRITSATGLLSAKDLAAVDVAFGQAATDGFGWIVLAAQMRVEEPDSLKVIQAAENMLGSVQRLTSEVRALKKHRQTCDSSTQRQT